MTHVISNACIDVKDGACVLCCPVDCIYEGVRTLYIHPDECIDCGVCINACPTQAIYEDSRLPADQLSFLAINKEFFEPQVSGLGSPGGACDVPKGVCDHPVVAAWPVKAPPS
jgi:NAD-dependent dihydropyrimidine dehydrogenase PreA subunit